MRTILKVIKDMRYFTFAICAAALAACDAPAQHDAVAATGSAKASVDVPHNVQLIAGTPGGDLGDWVKDIRDGIATVAPLVAKDAAAAQRMALELYVTRQEYAEMYYGVAGRIKGSAELAAAIETAEEHFHALMRLLANKTPAAADVERVVATLDEQQARVAELWRQSDTRLDRSPQ
ncbi:MAG: hypothetical protein ACT4O1_01410 [Gemmatimonadota bacterium]